ncbi:N-acetyltransferase family protein [Trichothermofontia sp.]
MTQAPAKSQTPIIRPAQHRDLEAIAALWQAETTETADLSYPISLGQRLDWVRRWYGLLKFLSLFPNPLQHSFCVYVAEQQDQILGFVQISPFNRARSTWKINRVVVTPAARAAGVGSQLLRHCLESILEARTWLLEVGVNHTDSLALYRQNGFQPLAQITHWEIAPEQLKVLATREPDLPNLLPVSNADAQLLCQLDTASMPPLIRQVFDRHIFDFKTSFLEAIVASIKQWLTHTEGVSGYVFESQRKAAIGYFQAYFSDRPTRHPHVVQMTVHPAYTWLYPELLAQTARLAQELPPQPLRLTSADYQSEREAYLEQIGATRIAHTLLMSRSVWHKLRETKPVSLESLQLSDVLQGLQPVRKPIPSRSALLQFWLESGSFTSNGSDYSLLGPTAAPNPPASPPGKPRAKPVKTRSRKSAPPQPPSGHQGE